MYTQNERGYHPSERANGRRWERCPPPARSVLEDFPAICDTERTVSIFYSSLPIYDLCAFCENLGLIFFCVSRFPRYEGPELSLEMDGNYVSRLE